MKFFALDTNLGRVKQDFLTQGEREIRTVHYHGMSFFFAILREVIYTIGFIVVVVGLSWIGFPWGSLSTIAFFLWLAFIFFHLLQAYIDWHYDFILITSDKVIMVDQSSVFQRRITPMTLDNFASVSSQTQFWNMFGFGKVILNLKEGVGVEMVLRFIPEAGKIAGSIADAVTKFQRNKGAQSAPADNISAGE